jgi:hypothetical protein
MNKRKVDRKNVKSFPIGIILILILLGINISSLLIGLINPSFIQYGPFIFTEGSYVVLSLINLVLLSIIFYGLIKRFEWGRKLAIIWFFFMLFIAILNLIFFFINPEPVVEIMTNILSDINANAETIYIMIFFSTILALIINIVLLVLIFSYLHKKKDFFVR